MQYESRILIVDGPEGDLQSLTMQLVALDYSVHYANDIDEAQLLAREEHKHLRAVLLSSSVDPTSISELARRFGREPACFVPTGRQPADDVVEHLARQGIRWHLWGQPSEQATRLVVSCALSERDPYELRLHLRVPVEFSGQIQLASQKADVQFRDICVGGACIVGETTASDGDVGTVVFEVDASRVELPIQVAWSTPNVDGQIRIIGLTFTEVDPASGRVIDGIIERILGRQRIHSSRRNRF